MGALENRYKIQGVSAGDIDNKLRGFAMDVPFLVIEIKLRVA